MDKIQGNMDTLSNMQLTAKMEGLDAECKLLLSSKEILAVILKETVDEYREYSREEIIGFIEPDSIESDREVSPGRTNSQVQGDTQEFAALNEKVSRFDIRLKAKNPRLSKEKIIIKLHIDVEPQKSCYPGYPIEKLFVAGTVFAAVACHGQYRLRRTGKMLQHMDLSGRYPPGRAEQRILL